MRALAVVALALAPLLAGCSAPPTPAPPGPAVEPMRTLALVPVAFLGHDAVRVCPPQSPSCVTSNARVGQDLYVQQLPANQSLHDLSFDVVWDSAVADPVTFFVNVVCYPNDDGSGCARPVPLANASGSLPLHLAAHGLDLPGANLTYEVSFNGPAPGIGGTNQRYRGAGNLTVLESAP